MKTARATWVALALLFVTSGLRAAIVVPGADGSDGALNITANTVIDLSQAVTAQWDANNAANAGKGVYDAVKWAVVFKYSSVNVSAGATVTFKNHPSRAPVVWLVSGNVTISGTVSLDGAAFAKPPLLAEPGPGGFRGGFGIWVPGITAGSGFGPGAGKSEGYIGFGGSYATTGSSNTTSSIYGNPSLIPLVGGSGGGGEPNNYDVASGGAGGGAILIACTETISISGSLRALGGSGNGGGDPSGSGGGGGIRLVAKSLLGGGTLSTVGGTNNVPGGAGRIRVERAINTNTLSVVPSPSVLQLTDGDTALLWPPSSAPTVQVVSIGGVAAPADPRASFDAAAPDVTLAQVSSTTVVVRTTNVESASQVKVRGTPRFGANFNEVTATNPVLVSSSPLTYDWTVTLPVQTGYSALQVRVVRP